MSSVVINDHVTPSATWSEWTSRLNTYTEWLNVQLKNHRSNRVITDLRHDLQDGVVVAQLVEALGGERVSGIDPRPTSPASRKENVERIFQHFSTKQVPISYCRAKDVLAGDLKCIMRLIHAVASHYRPESVLSPAQNPSAGYHSRCVTSAPYLIEDRNMTSNVKPTAVLARQKSDASVPMKKLSSLPIRRQPFSSRDCPKLTATLSSLALDHKKSPLRKSFTSLTCDRFPKAAEKGNTSGTGNDGTSRISCKVAPLQYSCNSATPTVHSSNLSIYRLGKKKSAVSRSQPCSLDSVDNSSVIQDELKKEKTCSCSNLKYADVEDLLRQVKDTKEQLLLLQQVLLHGNGSKFLKDSEQCVPYGSTNDVDTPRMVCGEKKDAEKEDIPAYKLAGKRTADTPGTNFKEENENLRRAIEEKEQEIKRLKASISRQISRDIDKKLKYPFSLAARTQREELQVVHEALTSLRKCFPANDPYQHTLDTIEQSLSALLERVNSLEIGALPPTTSETVPTSVHRGNHGSHNDAIRRPIPKISGFSVQRQDETRRSTKVVYYMDKSVTPFRCILNKRIGEATLRDFKLLFDRPGQYRYHFKTLDPEFGMVKEEVLHDDDILPGWDGKIIAWIEEDCS